MDGNKRTALATCLVFLSENEWLPEEKLDPDTWEALTLDAAQEKILRFLRWLGVEDPPAPTFQESG